MLNYALEGPKWTTPVVTWSFAPAGDSTFTNTIAAAYQATIEQAAAQWAAVTNLTLQQVAPGTPGTDITIGWGSFSGSQIGETDYSYSLGATEAFLPGMTIRIEDPSILPLSSAPGAMYQGTSTTLAEVALHEFGHALGLGLSSDPSAVLYLYLGPNNTTIGASDIAGIDALYGAPTTSTAAASSVQQAAAPGTVELSGDKLGVYRFFDTSTGTQFLTGSVSEANTTIATRPDLIYEGLAMAGIAPGADDPNAVPVYRFFDMSNGTHFFTTSQTEEANIAATRPDLVLEQTSFLEHATQQAGDVPVFRFFDASNGTHFFTSSDSERATISATRSDMTYEGVAFYAPPAS